MMQGSRREGRDEGQPRGSKPGEPLSIVLLLMIIIIIIPHLSLFPSVCSLPGAMGISQGWQRAPQAGGCNKVTSSQGVE